ncbi:MAG: hypothetical protein JXB19_11875 [Bacteroidales bacterium]|nr:hypothetical protein [Bacteroidales bacterium]
MGKKGKSKGIVFNAYDLLKFTWQKKWILIFISVAAFIIAVFVSLSITPRFESKVVLFPAASVSLSSSLTETSLISVNNRDILSFGEQSETERMLQILSSGKIKDHIMNKYDLMSHYEIDTASLYPYTQLHNKYNSNITFRRTEYNSIEISVLDTDPQTAADIANDIASYIDSVVYQIQLERATEAFRIVENEYKASQHEVERLNDSLRQIRNLGVFDYGSQVASLSEAYAVALAQNNDAAENEISEQMNILSRYGGTYIELSKKLETEMNRLGQLKEKYTAFKINVEQAIPQVYIVDHAVRAERKAVPKRSLIVIISTLSTFALVFLLLLIVDYSKGLK